MNVYKVVLLGEAATGKTTIIERLKSGVFVEYLEPTIGSQFYSHELTIGGETVKMEIWDTAGQERYRAMSSMYYRGAVAALVVYDITRRDSFEGAKMWIQEVTVDAATDCVIALVGNKADKDTLRQVPFEEAVAYGDASGVSIVLETSAKLGQNIVEVFTQIGEELLKQRPEMSQSEHPLDEHGEKKCC